MPKDKVTVLPADSLLRGFIEKPFLPEGKDENYLRDMQTTVPEGGWRHLFATEIEQLVRNSNVAKSWDDIWVTNDFNPQIIKNNKFYGCVRIGRMRSEVLQYHDLLLPVGITNSMIISCDIGNDVAIHDVHYIAHYIVGDRCILFNIQEMDITNHAKFGNGILKEGESESVRVTMEVMNEIGSRSILPFDGMITADAYMWAKFIDDASLQSRLKEITQNSFDNRRGYYGTIGNSTVIKNALILKDVKVGSHCYIKGASKLKNITIHSSEDEPSQIGEGVILVNGIVGYGCRIFYSCTAIRFILGDNSNLKYGARLINSFMGDNSTISCCEVLNNLIFPAHEQHHNNSFLIASVIMGQSNLAAGATIGSNHNSRSNDNEVEAGRGFWPGLCTSVKHSCKFASFNLLAKADFPSEMNIPFPFALVNNNLNTNELEVMPAYWWMYNMYALIRNSQKYGKRDKRVIKTQNIEFDSFAPDSMEEAIFGRKLIELWVGKAWMKREGKSFEKMDDKAIRNVGKNLLDNEKETVKSLSVFGEHMEKSKRNVRIIKAYEAYHAYGDMLIYYAAKNMIEHLEDNPHETFAQMSEKLESVRQREWINFGGQLMQMSDYEELRNDIVEKKLNSWEAIHNRYNEIWTHYPIDKLRHAYLALRYVLGLDRLSLADFKGTLSKAIEIHQFICDNVYKSREKDYKNFFRKSTYRNEAEMHASLGDIEHNEFVLQMREENESFKNRAAKLQERIKE